MLNDGSNTYLYGAGRIGELQGAAWAYHLPDGLGSVRQLTSITGSVTLAQRYDPFGEALSSVGGGASVYGFTGEQRDASGLTYLRARYYAPGVGRFINRDPSQRETNLYLYAGANPVNYTDPTGLWRWQSPTGQTPRREELIELRYMGLDETNKQLEYTIPDYGTRVDMFNSQLGKGNVYEIEPVDLMYNDHIVDKGRTQATARMNELNDAAHQGFLIGLRGGHEYDWNKTKFKLGDGGDWGGLYRVRDPYIPSLDLVAIFWEEGVIVWWLEDPSQRVVQPGPDNLRPFKWSKEKEKEYQEERERRRKRNPPKADPMPQPNPAPNPQPIPPRLPVPHPAPLPIPVPVPPGRTPQPRPEPLPPMGVPHFNWPDIPWWFWLPGRAPTYGSGYGDICPVPSYDR